MEREIDTVLITTDEYRKMYFENEHLKADIEVYKKAFQKAVTSVENFIRNEHSRYGGGYIFSSEKELLMNVGVDPETFNLYEGVDQTTDTEDKDV